MAGKNFLHFIRIGEALKQQDIEFAQKLREIGFFAQEIEEELMEGHIFIYPNIRVLLEGFCDLLIDFSLKLTIQEDFDNGKSKAQIHDFLDSLIEQNTVVSTLKNYTMQVKPHAFSMVIKTRIIEECFIEKGVDTRDWQLQTIRKGCSVRAHQMRVPLEDDLDAIKQLFVDRFDVLRVIHNGIYSYLVQALTGEQNSEQYVFPDEMTINGIIRKYQQRTKQYLI